MSAPRTWTVLELLRWTAGHFAERGIDTPRLDAECLLAHALGTDRLQLYVGFDKPVEEAERGAFRELVRRRAGERVPVALLTGEKEFWSLRLTVNSAVLVPRADTETLVQVALERIPDPEGEYEVLDVGTGSGAVALALATERPKARVTASDVSPEALEVARANAERLGLAGRVRLVEGSLFEPVVGECYDLVVSNPPYVAEAEATSLAPELGHEPPQALFGGPDGLAVLRPLVAGLAGVLRPGGAWALEIGPEQAAVLEGWCREAGLGGAQVHRDLAGRPRVVSGRRESDPRVRPQEA